MKKSIVLNYGIVFGAICALDRLSKSWVIMHPQYKKITSWLACDLSYNRGIAGGFLHSAHTLWYGVITAGIILFTVAFLREMIHALREGRTLYGESLVLAGACSNIYDRFVYGGVVDFISCSYADWYFPTFNIADMAIVVGVIIMVVSRYESA